MEPGIDSGCVIWLTGIPSSGKSTLARGLKDSLLNNHCVRVRVSILDGDALREGFTQDLGFSKEDRDENVRRVSYVARMLADAGIVVIAALVSPYQEAREKASETVGPDRFFEVHVRCSIHTAQKRDAKGMYAKAIAGEIENFTGVSDPYEAPESPFCVVNTETLDPDECVDEVLNKLGRLGG